MENHRGTESTENKEKLSVLRVSVVNLATPLHKALDALQYLYFNKVANGVYGQPKASATPL